MVKSGSLDKSNKKKSIEQVPIGCAISWFLSTEHNLN